MNQIEMLAKAKAAGKNCLVKFRQIFLPGPVDSKPAKFHFEWSDILLNGDGSFAIEAFRESGKALALDTEIPTPDGYVTMGDIEIGDVVFDETGKPCNVIATSNIHYNHNCYKVSFDDGTNIVADANHQWYVLDKHCRKFKVKTTEEMFPNQALGKPRNGYQEFAYRVPVAGALDLPSKELPISPYLLGYWLGDGTKSKPELSVWKEIIEEVEPKIKKCWHDVGRRNDNNGNFVLSLRDGFRKLLTTYNLLGNKHIPRVYFRASKEQRLELLRGLIDTDGTVAKDGTKSGTITYSSCNKQLAYDVYELVASLGIKATIRESRAMLCGKDCGATWDISFKTTLVVCTLASKEGRLPSEQHGRSTMRTIVKIEKIESVPTKCIMVDSPNHLFLVTRNCIITHNSSYVLRAFPLHVLVYPRHNMRYILIIMQNQRTASRKLKEISTEYTTNEFFKLNLVQINEQSERAFEVVVKDENGEEVNVRIEAHGKGGSVRGANWKDIRPHLVIIDDPQDIDDSKSDTILEDDWEWFLSDIYFLSQHGRVFLIGNNLGAKCIIERVLANKTEVNFEAKRLPVMDAKGIPTWPDYHPIDKIMAEKERFRKMGELDIWFREKMCIAVSPDSQIFKKSMFRYFEKASLKKEGLSFYTTVDLAISQADTADYTVICTLGVNSENHWFIVDLRFGRWNPSETIDNIFEVVSIWRPLYVGIEKVAFQAAMMHFLQKEMVVRNKFFTIKELLAERKKELRIQAMQPRFNAGTIWFQEGAEYLEELETELLTFPKGLHDDLCFLPGTIVSTIDGAKSIEDIQVGDMVLTHTGEYKPVLKTMINQYDGEILKIKANGNIELSCTPNHPFYSRTWKWGPGMKLNNDVSFIPAKDLDIGSNILHSVAPIKETEYTIDMKQYLNRYISENGYLYPIVNGFGGKFKNPKGGKVKEFVPVDNRLAFIFGYYAAEGSKNNHHTISFAGHSAETKVEDLLTEYFNTLSHCKLHPTENSRTIAFNSRAWRNVFSEFDSHLNKHLPSYCMELPKEQVISLVAGYFFGDGCFVQGVAKASSISKSLAYQIYHLLIKIGLRPTIIYNRRKGRWDGIGKSGVIENDSYTVSLGAPDTQKLVSMMYEINFIKEIYQDKSVGFREYKYDQTQSKLIDNLLAKRVQQINRVTYFGPTYNLEVKDNNSYVANGLVVHNCDALAYQEQIASPPVNSFDTVATEDIPLAASL